MLKSDERPLVGSALLARARLPRALQALRAITPLVWARCASSQRQPARRVRQATAVPQAENERKRKNEKDIQTLMQQEAHTKGWVVDTLLADTSGLNPQRVWYTTSLLNTKYEGCLGAKSPSTVAVDAGDGIPDGLLFASGDDIRNRDLQAVIEVKATMKQKPSALKELDGYCSEKLLNSNGLQRVLGIAAVGDGASGLNVEVVSYNLAVLKGLRQPVLDTNGAKVKTFPTSEEVEQYLQASDKALPVVTDSLLAAHGKKFNRLFREVHITDSKRPAVVGALMLALWHTGKRGGALDTEADIKENVTGYCKAAFEHANDPDLVDVLVGELDVMLSKPEGVTAVKEILDDLRFLGVGTHHMSDLSADFLGQLYEEFFRFTGGNTIGQVFTPRFLTTLMAKIAGVTLEDTVFDPCAGTGGFLIAAAHQAQMNANVSWPVAIDQLKNNLWGFESERVTAALCVVNMIVRGDGKSKVFNKSCMDGANFPTDLATVVLMNPPFPHGKKKKSAMSVEAFIDRGLEGLQDGGRLLSIVPDSVLFGGNDKAKKQGKPEKGQPEKVQPENAKAMTGAAWRKKMLKENTVEAVIQLPHFTFAPHADVDTHIIVMKKGRSPEEGESPPNIKFYRLHDAGLMRRKDMLRPISEDDNTALQYAAEFITGNEEERDQEQQLKKKEDMKAHKHASVEYKDVTNVDWSVGQNLPWTSPEPDELLSAADGLVLSWAGASITRAREVAAQRGVISAEGTLEEQDFSTFFNKKIKQATHFRRNKAAAGTLGAACDIVVGQKLVLSELDAGEAILVSGSMYDNGITGVYDLSKVLAPPFITVTLKGTPGLAFVHTEPCAVLNSCLVLRPVLTPGDTRAEADRLADLFLYAGLITSNSWRFNYARVCSRDRIAGLPLDALNSLSDQQRSDLVNRIEQLLSVIEEVKKVHSKEEQPKEEQLPAAQE